MKKIVVSLVFVMYILTCSAKQHNHKHHSTPKKSTTPFGGSKPQGNDRKSERKNQNDIMKLIKESQKVGIFIGSYVGDNYLSIEHGNLVAVENIKEANLFDIKLKSDNATITSPISLMPWVKGERRLLTYNSFGEDINVEIPISPSHKIRSDATIIKEVIGKNATYPVFEIMSQHRGMCITLDAASQGYYLSYCSNGGNDLQTFRFLTHREAKQQESRRSGDVAFDMREFLEGTSVPEAGIIVADISGVLFKNG